MTEAAHKSPRSWLTRFLITVLVFLLLSTVLLSAVVHYRNPLLNRFAKPYLEKYLSSQIPAQVTIGRLELESRHLRAGGLIFEEPGVFRVAALGMSLDFSLEGLRRGHVGGIRIFQPEGHIDVTSLERQEPSTPADFTRPALSIGQISVSGGSLALSLPGRTIQVRELQAKLLGFPASGDLRLEFALAQNEAPPLHVAAAGHFAWDAVPSLQVDSLLVDDHSLLSAPLTLRPEPEGFALGGEIFLAQFDHAQARHWLRWAGKEELLPQGMDFSVSALRLNAHLEEGRLVGALTADDVQITQAGTTVELQDVRLKASGTAEHQQFEGQLRIAETLLLNFSGTADGDGMAGDLSAQLPDVEVFSVRIKPGASVPVSGGLKIVAQFSWQVERFDLQGRMQGLSSSTHRPDAVLHLAPLSGTFAAKDLLGTPDLDVHLDLNGASFLQVQGGENALRFRLAQTSLANLAGVISADLWPAFLEKNGRVQGAGEMRWAGNTWRGRMTGQANDWAAAGMQIQKAAFETKTLWRDGGLNLSELHASAALSGHGLSLPHVQLAGGVYWSDADLVVELANLRLAEVDYLAADDMSALAGAQASVGGTLRLSSTGAVEALLNGQVQVSEALVHSFYGDLSELPLTFSMEAVWQEQEQTLLLSEMELAISDIGSLRGSGQWQVDEWRAAGTLHLPNLATAYGRHLRALVAPLFPHLGGLSPAGSLRAEMEGVHGPGGWMAAGMIEPGDLDMAWEGGSLSGLHGRLPFAFAFGNTPRRAKQPGMLAFSHVRAGPLSAQAARMTFAADLNGVSFADPWILDVGGGRVRIDGLRLGWEPQGLLIGGRTRIENVDLADLTQELEVTPMRGRLSADLGEFEYLDGYLQSQGEAQLEIFGGDIRVRNLRAHDIFRSYRSFEADIDLQGLDLAQLTQTFEFGEINGIIDGYVHDLRLFGKVPSAFVAELATRPRGRRNISVKAINNLAVISQGGLSAALSRGIYRFIDFYRYRSLGVFCALRNDVFVLKGTARADSDLYIVEGGLLPPRIDILAPQSAISFREMLRRLGRIDRAGSR
jgi:translocation and assembly module TamB